jgi:hypothetical protein
VHFSGMVQLERHRVAGADGYRGWEEGVDRRGVFPGSHHYGEIPGSNGSSRFHRCRDFNLFDDFHFPGDFNLSSDFNLLSDFDVAGAGGKYE